ncbi:MAG TPA: hypothetical protein VF708_10530 [Pyrinomonadaceae bacterium]|jgi:hypothetical protein
MRDANTSRPVYENLDTSYVNLGALLRYLQKRAFVGRVHVELDEYMADVFLNADGRLNVRETDQAMGREGQGEAAMHRLIVRAMMPGGLISIYEGASEEQDEPSAPPIRSAITNVDVAGERIERAEDTSAPEEMDETDWNALLRLSGELIAAVERAALGVGADFHTAFHAARLEAADDFSFLDPATGRFEYAYSEVNLHNGVNSRTYTSGVGTCLHRTVEKLASGPRAGSVRERIALELAVLARRRAAELKRLKLAPEMDRIAGTKVL